MKTVITLTLALFLAACSAPPTDPPKIIVFAAASTADALEAIAETYRLETGTRVTVVPAGSATLARQIQSGARADLFLSASGEWADYLAKHGLIAERRQFLTNQLVAVVPTDSKATLAKPEDLLDPSFARIAIGDPDAVPAGAYARQALRKLNLWDRLQPKLVPGADARQALLYVEQGETDAGIVYATDAKASPSVRTAFTFDPALSGPIQYPLVLLNPAARPFYTYLTSPESLAQFTQRGFTIPQKQ
ncbi:MAG: molybdate ABC transporter substrate-binding protein [FCB group bacterium]|jgi:molybdate transport system substrate-binding protein|nr:molybdate ABC transporter substrate-binding protein [FCB group bacterium]